MGLLSDFCGARLLILISANMIRLSAPMAIGIKCESVIIKGSAQETWGCAEIAD